MTDNNMDMQVTVYRHSRCKVCTHIAADKINSLLTTETPKLAADDIRKWLRVNYPTEAIPSIPAILNHKNKHLRGVIPSEEFGKLKIDRRTGKLVDQAGRKIEAVGILAAVKTIVSVGIANIMRDPTTITPSHTLDALKLLKQLNVQDDDPDADVWAETVVNPDAVPKRGPGRPPKVKSGNEMLDDITEVIDAFEEDLSSEETSDDSNRYATEKDDDDFDYDFPDPVEFNELKDA
jgi:hypothetical protein